MESLVGKLAAQAPPSPISRATLLNSRTKVGIPNFLCLVFPVLSWNSTNSSLYYISCYDCQAVQSYVAFLFMLSLIHRHSQENHEQGSPAFLFPGAYKDATAIPPPATRLQTLVTHIECSPAFLQDLMIPTLHSHRFAYLQEQECKSYHTTCCLSWLSETIQKLLPVAVLF